MQLASASKPSFVTYPYLKLCLLAVDVGTQKNTGWCGLTGRETMEKWSSENGTELVILYKGYVIKGLSTKHLAWIQEN